MDYFSRPAASNDQNNSTNPQTPSQTPRFPPLTPAFTAPSSSSRDDSRPLPALRLRRPPSSANFRPQQSSNQFPATPSDENAQPQASSVRRRSSSDPQRSSLPPASNVTRVQTADPSSLPQLASVTEERSSEAQSPNNHLQVPQINEPQIDQSSTSSAIQRTGTSQTERPPSSARRPGLASRMSTAATNLFPRRHDVNNADSTQDIADPQTQYGQDIVDLLDVVDPEVSTLTTLNNYQNSFVLPPQIGRFFNRTPTYDLSSISSEASPGDEKEDETPLEKRATATGTRVKPSVPETVAEEQKHEDEPADAERPNLTRLTSTLSSASGGHHYAVLPHGISLEGWSEQEIDELDDHVRHLLHSRKAKFRRNMRGFGKYVRTPLGAFVTTYSFLITFWGAAWVLFLIGWINVGNRQAYFIEICDQVLTALFCVVGIGLAPFRIIDSYHMGFIAHFHYLTWRLRKKKNLPELKDPNELPEQPMTEQPGVDIEDNPTKQLEESVLTVEQQRKFLHHQKKFSRSHTFYKSHETFTHYAFPLKLLIAIVCLFDCHSMFQIALGGTTWGIYYRHRPKALTAVILACSISCNIAGGITISVGDKMTRKKLIIEQMFRQGLTQEAIRKVERHHGRRPPKKQERKQREKHKSKAQNGKAEGSKEQEEHGS